MFELSGGFLYRVLKDAVLFFQRNRRMLSQADRVTLRARWKAEIEPELQQRHAMKIRTDVIIRDVRRMDEYPDADDNPRGMSPWFKAGLMGAYHRGIRAGLEWIGLVIDAQGKLIYADYEREETPHVTAILTGFIKYENIQHIDWQGDEFGGHPHIYCHFDEKGGTPYEALWLSERHETSQGWPYYKDLDTFKAVDHRSKKAGRSR